VQLAGDVGAFLFAHRLQVGRQFLGAAAGVAQFLLDLLAGADGLSRADRADDAAVLDEGRGDEGLACPVPSLCR
jgi:hypothetical protein